jgi:hypothetical protein
MLIEIICAHGRAQRQSWTHTALNGNPYCGYFKSKENEHARNSTGDWVNPTAM